MQLVDLDRRTTTLSRLLSGREPAIWSLDYDIGDHITASTRHANEDALVY